MKKIVSIVILTILTLSTITSQKKIQFGIKGGISFTNISEDYLVDKEYKTGFHIGGLVEIPFGSKFSLQPEILYSKQGTIGKEIQQVYPYPMSQPYFPIPRPVEYNLDYIQVPILAKFYVLESFSLELGPSFNFLIKDEIKYSDDTVVLKSVSIGEPFEFGGVIGVSYKIKSKFFTYFRYNQGFTDADSKFFDDAKNYGFMLGVGYLF